MEELKVQIWHLSLWMFKKNKNAIETSQKTWFWRATTLPHLVSQQHEHKQFVLFISVVNWTQKWRTDRGGKEVLALCNNLVGNNKIYSLLAEFLLIRLFSDGLTRLQHLYLQQNDP